MDEAWVERVAQLAGRIGDNVDRVILGKRREIEYLIVAILCRGHVLLEDVPGMGKTILSRAIAASLGLSFSRLQCTPDLLPSDVTGVSVYNQRSSEFEFRPGPVFAHVLLADEINRATPRTQAALLEAMQERQVTADGETRQLPDPFLVLATQNPIEFEGTFELPEAQLDRFLLRLSLGYPDRGDELRVLQGAGGATALDALERVVDPTELAPAQTAIRQVHLEPLLESYLLDIVQATRTHPDIAVGASMRGSLALYHGAQALAALRRRDYVLPDDVKELVPMVLPHRVSMRPESRLQNRDARTVIAEIVADLDLAAAEATG